MGRFASGKYAKAISDRSGLEFPYTEMVKEWNGSFVHISEYEEKQPQLQPRAKSADPQGLNRARPDRTEPATPNLLPGNPFSFTSGSANVTVTEPNHGRSNGDIVRFRNVEGTPGGLAFTVFENASGFSISSVTTNTYVFGAGSNATVTEKAGGMTVTAGPVTQQS